MNRKLSQFITSNWVVTLFATLIGVFLALYLNEQVASRKINKQKAIALDNLSSEISKNRKSLEKSLADHTLFLETFTFINVYKTEDDDYIIPMDTINAFRKKYPNVLSMTDSIPINSETYKYVHGEINMDINLLHISLTSITLETLRNSELVTGYGFECLLYIESLLNITNEIRKKDTALLSLFTSLNEMEVKNYDKVIQHLKFLIEYEKALLEAYDAEEELLNCE